MTLETTTITDRPNATLPLTGNERIVMDEVGEGARTVDAPTSAVAALANPAIEAAIDAHEAAADPHPGYLTPAEGNVAYEAAGAVAAHEAAADPHAQYAQTADDLGLGTDDSPTFAGLTITGASPVAIPHIHGDLAGSVYIHVKNTSGGQLTKGTPVRVVGAVGDTTTLEVAAADSASAGTMPAIGILADTLAINASGHATVAGELTGLNTAGYSIGQALYVAAGGGLTGTRPTTGTVQKVAIVGRVHANTGSITATITASLHPAAYSGAYGDLSGRPTIPAAADAAPQPLGTAAIGDSADYAREDHVHAMPSAGDVGADPAGTAAAAVSALESSLGDSATRDVGTTAGTVAAGNDARFHDAVTLAASVADVLSMSGQELQADDPGGDRLLFWGDSDGKLTHAAVGPGIVFDGSTLRVEEWLWVACSDENTALTTGTAKITFRMPFAATLLSVRASVNTAPVGANLVVDINEAGTSVLSTKLSIDAGEKTSTTAATAAVISDSSLADDAEITIDIDQVGSSTAGTGLKVGLYVRRI